MLWALYGTWAIYGVLLTLVALFGPIILAHKGGRTFIVCVAMVWLVATVVIHPIGFSVSFWASHLMEASAGVAATAVGYGVPVWGAAISIWTLKKRRASVFMQRIGSLLVAALLSQLSTTVAFVVATVFINPG